MMEKRANAGEAVVCEFRWTVWAVRTGFWLFVLVGFITVQVLVAVFQWRIGPILPVNFTMVASIVTVLMVMVFAGRIPQWREQFRRRVIFDPVAKQVMFEHFRVRSAPLRWVRLTTPFMVPMGRIKAVEKNHSLLFGWSVRIKVEEGWIEVGSEMTRTEELSQVVSAATDRRGAPVCENCGYDLRMNTTSHCPECGALYR